MTVQMQRAEIRYRRRPSDPIGEKIILGIIYGFTWFLAPEPKWIDIPLLELHPEKIAICPAQLFWISPLVIGGITAYLHYVRTLTGWFDAAVSGWLSCTVGAFVSLFVLCDWVYGLVYIAPFLLLSSIGSITVSQWLRRRYPLKTEFHDLSPMR